MRKTALIVLLAAAWGMAQQAPPAPPSAANIDILEHWRRATVALGQVVDLGGKKTFTTQGSAVIVGLDSQHVCLLTAKHMFYYPPEGYYPTQISMRLPKDSSSGEDDFGVVIPLVIGGNNLWRTTAQTSDLAVVRLPDLSRYKNLHAVGIKDFGTSDDIYQSGAVMILGYPGILGEHYQTTPIARGGMIAWTDPDDPRRKPFLVDANVFGGNSGGPVFRLHNGFDRHGNFSLRGGFSFIGIMSEDAKEYSDVLLTDKATYAKKLTQTNPQTLKPDSIEAEVKNVGGIGVVEPVSIIRELLEDEFGMARGSLAEPVPATTPIPPTH